ncbi:MAG: carboxypeptidase-like regulatory domain-containing protein [Cyclobacteriaceae bacterium]|nr:carboxypeptidase-like regulatory domain-containing protein [Cyclobacteriaceae bacterium]
MMKIHLHIVFLLGTVFHAGAQSVMEGFIRDEKNVPLPYAHVLNLTGGLGSISGDNGYFSIRALPGDTIRISFIGYQTLLIVAEKEIMDREVSISLSPDFIELPSLWVFADPKYKVPLKYHGQSLSMEGIKQASEQAALAPGAIRWIKASPAPNEIPVAGPAMTIYGPFSYFTKEEKEKRKAEEAYFETLQTITFARLMALKQTRERLMENFAINDHELDSLIILMNREVPGIQELKKPDAILSSVSGFLKSKLQ